MADYKLSIDLNFAMPQDALKVMADCEPLVASSSKEAVSAFNTHIKEQIEDILKGASDTISNAKKDALSLVNKIAQVKAFESNVGHACERAKSLHDELMDNFNRLITGARQSIKAIEDMTADANRVIKEYESALASFQVEISKSENLLNAMHFIDEMLLAQAAIITGAKVSLQKYEPKKTSQDKWSPQGGWEFKRQ